MEETCKIYRLSETSSKIERCNSHEFKVKSTSVFGFNPGENLDIKTDVMIEIPKGKAIIITTLKPLLLIGSPLFKGGKLTIRLHNSQIGKNGAYIISKGDELCKLTIVSTE